VADSTDRRLKKREWLPAVSTGRRELEGLPNVKRCLVLREKRASRRAFSIVTISFSKTRADVDHE
jgi:hypothetical protein